MFPQQITGLQQYRVPGRPFAIPFVSNITCQMGVQNPMIILSLFFFYTYGLFDGAGSGCCLALIILQPGPLFVIRHGLQA